jgi:L-amino acid N-acyltransferase YncA
LQGFDQRKPKQYKYDPGQHLGATDTATIRRADNQWANLGAINLDNRRSIALAKSIGMQREGIRKHFIYENNQWVDPMERGGISK